MALWRPPPEQMDCSHPPTLASHHPSTRRRSQYPATSFPSSFVFNISDAGNGWKIQSALTIIIVYCINTRGIDWHRVGIGKDRVEGGRGGGRSRSLNWVSRGRYNSIFQKNSAMTVNPAFKLRWWCTRQLMAVESVIDWFRYSAFRLCDLLLPIEQTEIHST